LKKAVWLLLTPFLIAGCGGFHSGSTPNSLSPASREFFQEISFPLPHSAQSKENEESAGAVQVQNHSDSKPAPDSSQGYCHPDELFPLAMASNDEVAASSSEENPTIFSAVKEDGAAAPESSEPEPSHQAPRPETGPLQPVPPNPPGKITQAGRDGNAPHKTGAEKSPGDSEPQLVSEFLMADSEEPAPESPLLPLPEAAAPPAMKKVDEVLAKVTLPSSALRSFPNLLNEKVKTFIDFFQTKADTFFNNSLGRSQAYEGMMKKILREKNLPEELFYLALIESGYNPSAQSPAKASGIWQFMTKTAQRFGLRVDKWVDERRDPEKSTYAAAAYLKNLHQMFNCWYLAAASYNAGEGRVLEAMKRANSQDFWEISEHRYLKQETKEYVPMMLAAMIIAQDPPRFGFSNVVYQPPLTYEKIAVPPGTRLDRIARAAETDLGKIQALNPSLRREKTPPYRFEIKLPPGKTEVFQRNFYKKVKSESPNGQKYKVRRGDTLARIAKKYRVGLKDLCERNCLSPKSSLRPGLTLLLPR
jgi:soluble lytic murein transglycosylase-like protein/LysM repeat protein